MALQIVGFHKKDESAFQCFGPVWPPESQNNAHDSSVHAPMDIYKNDGKTLVCSRLKTSLRKKEKDDDEGIKQKKDGKQNYLQYGWERMEKWWQKNLRQKWY